MERTSDYFLHLLSRGETLDRHDAEALISLLLEPGLNQVAAGGILALLSARTITLVEIQGFISALFRRRVKLHLNLDSFLDVCGTGGDGKNTFNISTASAFVVASCGVPVVKHGNVSSSSSVGSSNVLSAAGLEFTDDEELLKRQVSELGIALLHAPLFHPSLKAIAPVRRQLGIRTFFNILGPLLNPASPTHQLIGVASRSIQRLFHHFLIDRPTNYSIVFSCDGYDEISLTGPFIIQTRSECLQLEPQDLGLNHLSPSDIQGSEFVEHNKEIFLNILEGKGTEAQRMVVAANAGVALWTFRDSGSLTDSVKEVMDMLSTSKPLKIFEELKCSARREKS